jgi:hypothetical protein
MKIIRTDNFDREDVPDVLVASNTTNKVEADIMLNALLATCSTRGQNYYILVEDDYKLKRHPAEDAPELGA